MACEGVPLSRGIFLKEMRHQAGDVRAPLPERRQDDRHSVQTGRRDLREKLSFCDGCFQVAMSRGDDPRRHGDPFAGPPTR